MIRNDFFFSFSAGKLLIAPLLLVIGLALGAIAVVIGKKRRRSETSTHFEVYCPHAPGISLVLNTKYNLFVMYLVHIFSP